MSPTAEKKPMDVTRVADFASDADVQWKSQRKLKHQRDIQKRANANNANARRSGAMPTHREGSHHGARSIPTRRKDKHAAEEATSPMLTSRSVPMGAARSWPPEKSEENLDPNNWSLDGSASLLATSAPESSELSRSFGAKREARTMTLFESAMIFNEAGNLLSHDNFDAMASSPELGPQSGVRRKTKRRVGRHRPEKKKGQETAAGDRLTKDDVVLELMHVLLPDMDVTKELNMLFLGGSRHQGDVFYFEDDDVATYRAAHSSAEKLSGCKVLMIDVLKFQSSLSKLLFDPKENEYDLPPVGSTSAELVDRFLSDHWIATTMLRIVKFEVLAQYDAFAVLLAVYRALPLHRDTVLKSLVGVCLAIYDHQAMEHLPLASDSRKLVSMKGAIALLNAILIVTEVEIMETPEIFGDSPEAIDEALDVVCERVIEAVKLLMRSSPGSSKYKSDGNNQVEKFQEGSDSVEATTYSALGEVICRLAAFSPLHGQDLLTWVLRKWPQRNVQLQLFYLRFITGILMQFMIRGVFLPEDLTAKTFSRLRACIKSPHFLIAKEAAGVCGNLPLMDMYLSRDRELREQVSAALHANATTHWNDRIREMSDEYFDLLLDLA